LGGLRLNVSGINARLKRARQSRASVPRFGEPTTVDYGQRVVIPYDLGKPPDDGGLCVAEQAVPVIEKWLAS
jgi:hypothetical protein